MVIFIDITFGLAPFGLDDPAAMAVLIVKSIGLIISLVGMVWLIVKSC
jgi:hypothetical protein